MRALVACLAAAVLLTAGCATVHQIDPVSDSHQVTMMTNAARNHRVTIELEFTLVRVEDREPLLLETYAEHEEVIGSGVGDSVEAFGRALHRILERLVLDLPEVQ